jgi:hypothetical protein
MPHCLITTINMMSSTCQWIGKNDSSTFLFAELNALVRVMLAGTKAACPK